MLLCQENENYPLLDVEKAYKDFEGAHQPYMVHEVKKLDMIIFSICQDKVIIFSTLIPPIDFIISKIYFPSKKKSKIYLTAWWNKKHL